MRLPVITHPPGCYWANPNTGTIQRQCNPLLAALLSQAGFVGKDNTPAGLGPAFNTFQDAKNWVEKNPSQLRQTYQAGQHAASDVVSPLGQIGDFFGRLTQGNTWLRAGEVAGGFLLVYVGLKALTSGTPAGEVGKTVKRGVQKTAKPIKFAAKKIPGV